MDVVGYIEISKDATNMVSAIPISKFQGQTVRVFEFAQDGGALVIDREATGIAMVEKECIKRSFKCTMINNDIVAPPGLNFVEQMLYTTKCMSRKGGYNNIIKEMVIQFSLMKGKFTDDFLWQKQ